MPDDVS